MYQQRLVAFSNCHQTDRYTYSVSLGQPPSLRSTATHTVFHLVYKLGKFELSHDTTYRQYVYAVKARSLSVGQLFPETFHKMTFDFQVPS